jgi:hypothetical protein
MEHSFFSLEGQRILLDDVNVLLNHLSALPEPRLDAAFAGIGPNGTGILLTRPPAGTPTKDDFLKAVMQAAEQLAPGTALADPDHPVADRPGLLGADGVAFLIAARDFLATLARPATVESIRITSQYVRAIPLAATAEALRRGLARLFGRRRTGAAAAAGMAGSATRRSTAFGCRLAVQVRLWHLGTLALVSATLLLSIYALIGRGLVREVGATDAKFAALAADMDLAEQADAPVFTLIAGGGGDLPGAVPTQQVRRYCEGVREAVERRGATEVKVVYFATRKQQRLCDRHDGYNKALWQLFDRLDNWRSRFPGNYFPVTSRCPAGQVPEPEGGCISPAAIGERAELSVLQRLRLEVVAAQVVLQAITEYLLPCLYAILGALAAALGNMARKAEDATLSFSDGGVIFRTLVLGVLFGAVIGLFSSQLGPSGEEGSVGGSLTPAALSLLAGYSVAQVFQFFDGLSLRVFGPRSPAGTPTG